MERVHTTFPVSESLREEELVRGCCEDALWETLCSGSEHFKKKEWKSYCRKDLKYLGHLQAYRLYPVGSSVNKQL